MTFSDIIGQGGFLAVFGMGIVVGYLFSMVFGPVAKERASAAGRDVNAPALASAESIPQPVNAGENKNVVAAITAAVNEYRKNNN